MSTLVQTSGYPKAIAFKTKYNATVGVTEQYLVTDITTPALDTRSYVNEILNTSGLPVDGDLLPGTTQMIAVGRNIRKFDDHNPSKAFVEVEYESRGRAGGEGLFLTDVSLKQVASANDGFGNQITVSHTYPAGDPDFASATQTQGGEISVLSPTSRITCTKVVQTSHATNFALRWIGRVNAANWGPGGVPGTWLCVGVKEEDKLDFEDGRSLFRFDFEYDPRGWQPVVYFRDQRTGQPPSGLVAGVGIKTITWYPSLDFNILFPT